MSQTEDDDTVTVSVMDNGPEVPDEIKGWVLEGEGFNPRKPGTGFGLYLTREIVESYDGELDIRDGESGGTIVRMAFERAR